MFLALVIFLSIALLVITVVLVIAKIDGSELGITVAMVMAIITLFITIVSWGEYFTQQ